ncbi:N6-adenosine-specific RNA methylase IME4 [Bradyrhizobium sp. LM2.7]
MPGSGCGSRRAHLLAKVPFKTEVMLADGECVIATVDLPLAYACQLALGMDAYSTCYVWTKTDAEHPDVSGSGLLVWDQDELLLQFKRGRGLPKPESSEKFGSNYRERPREHSRKPDFYRRMIATMVGRDSDGQPLPVLELFARVDAEHPLPENWSAWGNQAGVSLQGNAIAIATDASDSSSSAGATETVILSGYDVDRLKQREWAGDVGTVDDEGEPPAQSDDIRSLWMHEAIQGRHVVSNTRDGSFSVATCQCGWRFRAWTVPDGWQQRDDAIDNHWREIIAQHDAALPEPSGETEAAAAEATSEGASPAAAVSGAPYDASDAVTIDQLAGSEWLAPPAVRSCFGRRT